VKTLSPLRKHYQQYHREMIQELASNLKKDIKNRETRRGNFQQVFAKFAVVALVFGCSEKKPHYRAVTHKTSVFRFCI
jgi:hypothetical protein